MGMALLTKISLAICLISLTHDHLSLAQTPQDYVSAHNAARAKEGVGPMTWNATLEAYAQEYVKKLAGDCKLVHSNGPYGENLSSASWDMTAEDVVKIWVDEEKPHYDYNANKCVGGDCGHYTQAIWKNSVRLGCAKVKCGNGDFLISCNYDPPGNWVDEHPF